MTTRDLYSAAHAARFDPGEPYRPSNGTEGEMFMERWCYLCRHDQDTPDGDSCDILANALIFDIGDPDYPAEWVHDARGQPCCKAFAEQAGGSDGMPAPTVPAPGQMGFPGFETEEAR